MAMRNPDLRELYTQTWVHPPIKTAQRVPRGLSPAELAKIVRVPPAPREPETGVPDFQGALDPVVRCLERTLAALTRRDGKENNVDIRFVARCRSEGRRSTSVSLFLDNSPSAEEAGPAP